MSEGVVGVLAVGAGGAGGGRRGKYGFGDGDGFVAFCEEGSDFLDDFSELVGQEGGRHCVESEAW